MSERLASKTSVDTERLINQSNPPRKPRPALTYENVGEAAWRLKQEFDLPEDWQSEVYSWLSDHREHALENIGLSGPVLFNRKSTKAAQRQSRLQRPVKSEPVDPANELILDAIKALGVSTTQQAVSDAVAVLYPTGIADNQGDVIRKTFLYLQGKRP